MTSPVDEVANVGTQVHNSASGTNAAVTATLPGVAGQTTYLDGFEVTGLPGTVLAAGDVTVSGVVGGPFTYEFVQSLTNLSALIVEFPRPIAASAQGTAVSVSCAALGLTSGKISVVAHGSQI